MMGQQDFNRFNGLHRQDWYGRGLGGEFVHPSARSRQSQWQHYHWIITRDGHLHQIHATCVVLWWVPVGAWWPVVLTTDDICYVLAWESIRNSFPKSKKGSSIVVTTRFKSVAKACRCQQGRVYELKSLHDENSYKLFCQIISSAPNVPTNGAKALVKKCGGLPLAIILVAGLVASKLRSESNRIHVEDHHLAQEDKEVGDELKKNKDQQGNDVRERLDKAALVEELEKNKPKAGNDIIKKLENLLAQVSNDLGEELKKNLSTEGVTHIVHHCYYQLPADLKTCLLYLSMFPKGCLISRKRLIRRWIAEGFIAEKHGKMVEEIAEDCFNELINRNLIRAVNSSSNGKVKSCQVHDMVLEYIVVKSSNENFITLVGGHWHTPFPTYKCAATAAPSLSSTSPPVSCQTPPPSSLLPHWIRAQARNPRLTPSRRAGGYGPTAWAAGGRYIAPLRRLVAQFRAAAQRCLAGLPPPDRRRHCLS
ncbi:disease resistance RPP13-like protein 4 [Panicum miliaceum]|uniref:Disease resistance RPP13-like protein 4 n=1 Tax=Panicum miliaceum TaxID=4540 RepID=A0A3L6PKI9_PANMI|nr:disease resistance RPP13-like protein 4 [Panicum miliaceum]